MHAYARKRPRGCSMQSQRTRSRQSVCLGVHRMGPAVALPALRVQRLGRTRARRVVNAPVERSPEEIRKEMERLQIIRAKRCAAVQAAECCRQPHKGLQMLDNVTQGF